MKFKNRKGSTLALTLIIFAVLMIFGTFILNFMVTENKQAIYYQDKTQAYYTAKSAVDIVESALVSELNSFDKDDRKKFIDKFNDERDVDIAYKEDDINYIKVVTEGKEEDKNRVLAITASATHGKVEQKVKKVIYSTTATKKNEGGLEWKGAPLVAIEKAWRKDKDGNTELDEKHKDKNKGNVYAEYVEDSDLFKLEEFPAEPEWSGVIEPDTINGSLSGDYYYNGNVVMKGNISVSGKANLYIRGNLKIESLGALNNDTNSKPDDLNIYIYNNIPDKPETYGLDMQPNQSAYIKANFYVRTGKTNVDLKKAKLEGNIISHAKYTGDESNVFDNDNYTVRVMTDDSSKDTFFKGSILAPNGEVILGGKHSGGDKNAVFQDGIILGKYILIEGNNHKKNFEFLDYILEQSKDGVTVPVDTSGTITIDVIKYHSYYTIPN